MKHGWRQTQSDCRKSVLYSTKRRLGVETSMEANADDLEVRTQAARECERRARSGSACACMLTGRRKTNEMAGNRRPCHQGYMGNQTFLHQRPLRTQNRCLRYCPLEVNRGPCPIRPKGIRKGCMWRRRKSSIISSTGIYREWALPSSLLDAAAPKIAMAYSQRPITCAPAYPRASPKRQEQMPSPATWSTLVGSRCVPSSFPGESPKRQERQRNTSNHSQSLLRPEPVDRSSAQP